MSSGQRRRRRILLQLYIVGGVLAVIALTWFSLGRNVLAPPNQAGVPPQLGTLELVNIVEGSGALTQINRLHGTNIELVGAYIAQYAQGGERATVWVGRAASSSAAAELAQRMQQAIGRGNAGFTNLQKLTVAGGEVYRVEGAGGEHFFYHSAKLGDSVVWLTVEAGDALAILKEALEVF